MYDNANKKPVYGSLLLYENKQQQKNTCGERAARPSPPPSRQSGDRS